MTHFTDRVVALCEWELRRWSFGRGRVEEQPFSSYVGEYWQQGLGILRRDGSTTYVDPAGRSFRPAWSAAFVSYVYRLAGASSSFLYHEAHIHYVIEAIRAATSSSADAGFVARNPEVYCPKLGDLITETRSGTALSVPEALSLYGPVATPLGNFVPTHSDVVVEIDQSRSQLRTIGGNIYGGTVGSRWWRLTAAGYLAPADRLLCIIDCRL